MDYAIKLAKELLTPKDLVDMSWEEKKAELIKCMRESTEFEKYCYEHNFHPQRIKDMAMEELEQCNVIQVSETEFEKRLAEANDKDSLAQLAYDVIEASCDNKPQAKLLCSRFEKMLDKGLDINTIVDGQICIDDLQYGYTDYHLEVARLIFDRCGLPMAKCDGETFFDWVATKVMYDCYNCDFLVKLFLLCLAYTDEKFELMKMNENLYPEMFDECTMYTSIRDAQNPDSPLKLDYKVFRNFENIDYCIEMLEQKPGYYGCWKMHIFDKKSKLEIAVYG